MKSAVVAFAACLAAGMALSLAGVAVSQAAAIAVQCNSQRIVLPTKKIEVSFETGGLCNDLAKASQKSNEGKKLSEKEAERVKLVTWLDANLTAGDMLRLDRFGRGHLMRCSTDPNAQGFPKSAPKIGDGAYEMYVLIELPATATACAR
jgi:hypothetical protein